MIKVEPEINVPEPGKAILLVGRDPGEDELKVGRPFVGRAGEELDYVLADAGVRRQDVNITNVVPWRPAANDFKKHNTEQVEQGLRQLYLLIDQLKPTLIIAMGNEASYALVPDWPTGGRGIFGAKGINDRRGYFWETALGNVLTTLHPATITRQAVPNRALITNDMIRARQWLRGKLPRHEMPDPIYIPLSSEKQVQALAGSQYLAADIETRWESTELLCCGFCGDDMQPYVAKYGKGFKMMEKVLTSPVIKVFHNGWGFDIPFLLYDYDMDMIVGYEEDTQNMWHALEPELAGKDIQADEKAESKLTRKGLAFLATLSEPYSYNIEWWKNYPDDDDPEHNEKMYVLNAIDAYVTRLITGPLLSAIEKEGVEDQYRLTFDTGYGCMIMQKRGIVINDSERRTRIKRLAIRGKALMQESSQAALDFIEKNELDFFRVDKQCKCCGGGKIARQRCWRCAGFEKKPGKKDLLELASKHDRFEEHDLSMLKKEQLEELVLAPCSTCEGRGKNSVYHFNPGSWQQMQELLYHQLATPKSTWKGKTTTNEQALMKVLRWAQGGKIL